MKFAGVFWIILLIFWLPLKSLGQKLTPKEFEALRQYIYNINEKSASVNDCLPCLHKIFITVERQKQSVIEGRPANFELPCLLEITQATNQRLALEKVIAKDKASEPITSQAESFDNNYTNILEFSKQLDKYLQAKLFIMDGFSNADSLFKRLGSSFSSFDVSQHKLKEEILAYYKLKHKRKSDSYTDAVSMMDQIMVNNYDFITDKTYYFSSMDTPPLTLNELESMISRLDSLISMMGEVSTPRYPMDLLFRNYKDHTVRIKKRLSSANAEFSLYGKIRRDVYNELYLDFHELVNRSLLETYNQFVEAAAKQNRGFIPQFVQQGRFEVSPSSYEPPSFSSEMFDSLAYEVEEMYVNQDRSSKEEMPRGMILAMNSFIDFTNDAVQSNRFLQQDIKNYKLHADYYQGIDFKKYEHNVSLTYLKDQKYSIPYGIYKQALKSANLIPDEYKDMITGEAKSIILLLEEIGELEEELSEYVENETYKSDNLEKSDQIMYRFITLFDNFDKKKEKLFLLINSVYDQYEPSGTKTSWYKTSLELLKSIEEAKNIYFKLKDKYLGIPGEYIPVEGLKDQAVYLADNQKKLMRGIRKLGRDKMSDPHNPYEHIIENSYEIVGKVEVLEPNIVDDYQTLNEFVFLYNAMVDDYNKFADLSKVRLLKYNQQPYNFDLTPRQAASITIDIDFVSDVKDFSTMAGYAPVNLVLLLDVSASMNGRGRLGLLKESFLKLVPILREQDEVSIIVYSGKARVALPPTSMDNKEVVKSTISSLRSGGQTNGDEGLQLAYSVAKENFIQRGNNRIILATDGKFPVSRDTQKKITEGLEKDIHLSVFDFNSSKDATPKLKKLSEKGGGTYELITLQNSDNVLLGELKARKLQ
ncbi:MAG: VWA domain-containing protein [Bacteroidota bacterium]